MPISNHSKLKKEIENGLPFVHLKNCKYHTMNENIINFFDFKNFVIYARPNFYNKWNFKIETIDTIIISAKIRNLYCRYLFN